MLFSSTAIIAFATVVLLLSVVWVQASPPVFDCRSSSNPKRCKEDKAKLRKWKMKVQLVGIGGSRAKSPAPPPRKQDVRKLWHPWKGKRNKGQQGTDYIDDHQDDYDRQKQSNTGNQQETGDKDQQEDLSVTNGKEEPHSNEIPSIAEK